MSKRTNDTPAEWYKQTENEYINKRNKLVFDYYNSQVLKKNKLLNI